MLKKHKKAIFMYEPSGKGGLAKYTMNLCKNLAEMSYRVTLLTASSYEFKEKLYNKYEINDCLLPMITNRFYLKYWLFWAVDRFYRAWNNAYVRNKIVDKFMPDIIHIQLTIPIIDVLYLRKISKKHKIVYTVHDVIRHTGGIQNNPKLLKKIYEAVEHIIVHTKNNKTQLIKQFGIRSDKITVIPHGVDPPPAEILSQNEARKILGLPYESKILLFFGSIRQNKGLDVLLKSMPDVCVSNPNVKLLIAGNTPRNENFKKYDSIIRNLNIKDNIIIHRQFINEEKVPLYFISANVVVLPYLRFASQSGVLAQAYTYERPVVVSNVGGLGEAVRDDETGFVVSPGSSEEIGSEINRLLISKKLYNKFINNMRKTRSTKYNWRNISKMTKEVYESILLDGKQNERWNIST